MTPSGNSPRQPVLIDTNLFVLLVVGHASVGLIGRHKRLKAYAQRDYDELVKLLANAERVLITPNVAAECASLAAQIESPAKESIRDSLSDLISRVVEIYVESSAATKRNDYRRLGLTDAVILEAMVRENAVVLTVDVDLYLAALMVDEYRVVNFNHIRETYL